MTAPEPARHPAPDSAAHAFIARWRGVEAGELAIAQTFLIELCDLLDVPRPHPTDGSVDYMFERPVVFRHGDGTTSDGRIDCYRRGCFVWENKRLRGLAPGRARAEGRDGPGGRTPRAGFDEAMLAARAQAENYARALPAEEGRPPFIVVCDVGHVIELYAEFTRSGATYTPFPDARSHRIPLEALADPAVRERLRRLWLDPLSLDPARTSARVTREVAAQLAELARALEADGHAPTTVAAFLSRCLFSMFAEDVGLLPRVVPPGSSAAGEGEGAFVHLLKTWRDDPPVLARMLAALWQDMDQGRFSAAVAAQLRRFNGKLFKPADPYVLPLSAAQIDRLLAAARANWREVEPAIFGTLLERALDPAERHALGAHYTPRAYVERLVLPTVIEPLRAEWLDAQTAAVHCLREAEALDDARSREKKLEEARAELRRFHHRLCTVRVLDPACGSGNFLYVTLEHLKRLEAEVLSALDGLGEAQARLGLGGQTVTLAQLLGIEVNPRAAAVAELVLWIGWLQWHERTVGLANLVDPVIHDYGNIACRDAVLAWRAERPALDADGRPLTRWDGRTMKPHPVTGAPVPDEAARVPVMVYDDPRPADWPEAEFIVGNPPFIGDKRLRQALGDGYVEALRTAWREVPDSAEFVMFWWQHAAQVVRAGRARRFGFITTNSLRQTFNRRVVAAHLAAPKNPLRLAFAIPDHPWVDAADGAAVRIAMTVGTIEAVEGRLLTVTEETPGEGGETRVTLAERRGTIQADLRIGADVASARSLRANGGISVNGMMRAGEGFIVTPEEAQALGLGREPGLERVIRPFRNGRDLTDRPRGVMVIDAFGLTAEELRIRYPAVFQRLVERVKPERDQNNRPRLRTVWWEFAEPRKTLRKALAGLSRYIATVETAKHRAFQFLPASIVPEHKLIAVASDDALHLGVLSSALHVEWALAAGGWLGVGNDPVYVKTRCFEPFPFPDEDTGLTPALAARIRALAEQIDAHRKARQAADEAVTLTGLYNVLEALRAGRPLTPKERALHEAGLVAVLASLHEELDAAVLAAYGWADLGPPPWADAEGLARWREALLERLVALNARRAAEEAAGTVRWLRPAFQAPAEAAAKLTPEPEQTALPGLPEPCETDASDADDGTAGTSASAATGPRPWPAALPAQLRAVADLLAASAAPLPLSAIEATFRGKGGWKKTLPGILDALEALGRARRTPEGWR